MIGYAFELEREESLGIEYHVGSYSNLDRFDDGDFDMVLSTMALMDGPDYEGTMREFYRVLRPGGKMAFSILHPVFAAGDRMDWRLDENGEADGITVSSYFTRGPTVAQWQFGANPNPGDVELFKIPYFPRTLTGYINVQNLFDKDPQSNPGTFSTWFGGGTGLGVYGDERGRRFVVGLTYDF